MTRHQTDRLLHGWSVDDWFVQPEGQMGWEDP